MLTIKKNTVIILATSALAACGNQASNFQQKAGGNPSASNADVLTAQQSANSAIAAGSSDAASANHNNGSGMIALVRLTQTTGTISPYPTINPNIVGIDGSLAPIMPRPLPGADAKPLAADLGIDRDDVHVAGFEQPNGNGWVMNANLTFNPNSERRNHFKGEQSVVISWASPISHSRNLVVDSNVIEVLPDGDKVAITSLDPNHDTLDIAATGRAADGNVTLTIIENEHRVRTDGKGEAMFDMNITTDPKAPLVVINAYNVAVQPPAIVGRLIQSGISIVHHNRAKFTGTHTYSNLDFDLTGNCLCPVSGSVTQVIREDKGGGYTRLYTYTGCGVATVVTSASTMPNAVEGTVSLTLANCSHK